MTSDTMTIHILFRQEIIYNPDTSPRRVASGNVFTTTFPLPLPRQRPPQMLLLPLRSSPLLLGSDPS